MKIVFFVDSLQTGGAEKSILALASNLKSFKVIVVILYSDKDDLRQAFYDLGIQVIDLEISRQDKFWFWKGKLRFQKIVKELQPDIIHAHLFKSEIIARISNLPSNTKLIGSFVNDSYSRERYRSQSFLRNLKLNFFKWCDRVTVNKNYYITSITNAIKVTNCNILNFPLDRTIVINRGRKVNLLSGCYKFDSSKQDSFEFIAVGRLLERKGYFELIDAAEKLKSKYSNFKLSIVGSGVDELAIKEYAHNKALDNIIFMGHRNDVEHLLMHSNCFIFASHYEGQGGALVEAMLSGIPIIASDIPVFKEQVSHDFTARLFKVKDATSLSNEMEWIIYNYEKAITLGKNARNMAVKRYDIEVITKQTEQFYLNVISGTL